MRSEKHIRKVIKYLEKYIKKDIDYPPQIHWHESLITALKYTLGDYEYCGASESFYKKYEKLINKENK